MLKSCILACVVAVSSMTLHAKPPVDVRLNVRVGQAPKDITVFATLDPHEANRYLTIAIDNGSYGVSTLKQLDGIDAPVVVSTTFSRVREGRYIVVVSLQRAGGQAFQATSSFCLGGMNTSCAD